MAATSRAIYSSAVNLEARRVRLVGIRRARVKPVSRPIRPGKAVLADSNASGRELPTFGNEEQERVIVRFAESRVCCLHVFRTDTHGGEDFLLDEPCFLQSVNGTEADAEEICHLSPREVYL